MDKKFDIYVAKAKIDRGQFRLPKIFQDVEPREQEFVIIRVAKTLRIMTRKIYEEKYEADALPKEISHYSPSKYTPDEQWRGTFSQIHLEKLGNPTEVYMQGMKDFVLVKLCDADDDDEELERILEEKDRKIYGGR